MKITIIKEDNTVVIDNLGFDEMDLSSVETNIHAIQFDTDISKGHIEYVDDRVNEEITDITSYQSIIDSHAQKKTELDTQEQKAEDDFNAYKETYEYKRSIAYPSIEDQLDMQYHDKINGTTTWEDAVAKVKSDNPKS
tara:strand:+ start:335 stop:748 length:414 start_codon:yes stop_codon:yes gene_type:complete